MTAPTTFTCQNSFKAEVSTDGTSWTDISGEAVAITLDGGEQLIGEQMTAENAFALMCGSNKTQPIGLTIRSVYSEDAAGAFETVWARYAGTTKTIYARFAPRGGTTGNVRFSTSEDGTGADDVPIVSCMPPALESGAAGVALFEVVLRSPALYKEDIPS